MLNRWKKKAREIRLPLWLMIPLCVGIIWVIFLLFVKFWGDQTWFTALAYLLAASAIVAGVCVAYRHLTSLQGIERAHVLAILDTCWVGAELSLSRAKFRTFGNGLKSIQGSKKWPEEIKDKLKRYEKNRHTLYNELLNMVDFFETLGYFSKVGYILPRDALELYGPGIKGYEEVFRQYILELQEEEQDKSIDENFIWLADELNKQSD